MSYQGGESFSQLIDWRDLSWACAASLFRVSRAWTVVPEEACKRSMSVCTRCYRGWDREWRQKGCTMQSWPHAWQRRLWICELTSPLPFAGFTAIVNRQKVCLSLRLRVRHCLEILSAARFLMRTHRGIRSRGKVKRTIFVAWIARRSSKDVQQNS